MSYRGISLNCLADHLRPVQLSAMMLEQPLAGDEHPLLLELKSTRVALAGFQEEAHVAAVKLQRHSLESARTHERSVYLQQENDLLRAELITLRSSPTQTDAASTSNAHVQELTLSLRKLSHKLTLTEEALHQKTEAWLTARADVTKARMEKEAAYELIDKVHAREEAEKVRAGELEVRIQKLEEEMRMSDFTIAEYAALVRDMEARPRSLDSASNGHANPIPLSTLSEGKLQLQHLIDDFRSRHDDTVLELQKTRGELEFAQSRLDSEKKYEQTLITELTQAKGELDQLKISDDTAAKMVARYMQFSQSSTNTLLASVDTLKARHAATLYTLSSQNHLLASQIRSLETQNDHLRSMLDELGGEIMKEKYGRRREIGLRIRMGGRQERLAESLRRWVRKGDEVVGRVDRRDPEEKESDLWDSLLSLSQDARILLESLDEGGADEETALSLSGARAREVMVVDGIDGLLEELRLETERRVMLQARPRTDEETCADEPAVDAMNENPQKPEENSCEVPAQDDHTGWVMESPPSPGADQHALQSHSVLPEENISPTSALNGQTPLLAHQSPDMTTTPIPTVYEATTQSEDTSPSVDSADFSRPNERAGGSPLVLPSAPVGEYPAPHPDLTDSNQVDWADLPSEILYEAPTPDHTSLTSQSLAATPSSRSETSCTEDRREAIPMGQSACNSSPSDEPPESSSPREPKVQNETYPHSLLPELAKVSKRYDVYQRAFGDCHLALEDLKATLASSNALHSNQLSQPYVIPLEVLSAAVTRLDDFTEDVRVELEIKVSDEILLAKGYEALLRVPEALKSFPSTNEGGVVDGDDADHPSLSTVEHQIETFVDGTDAAVRKAKETFAKKLEDVQHDIAVLKKALHDPQSLFELPTSYKEDQNSTSAAKQGGGWTSWIRGTASKPTTPLSGLRPSLGAFGNTMTSPGLKYSPSFDADQLLGTNDGESSRKASASSSFISLNFGRELPAVDPLSVLGLKIPMPSFHQPLVENRRTTPTPVSAGARSLLSPTYPASLGIGPPPMGSPKARTLSTMYRLGLDREGRNSVYNGTGTFSRSVSTSSSPGSSNPCLPSHSHQQGREVGEAREAWGSGDHDIE